MNWSRWNALTENGGSVELTVSMGETSRDWDTTEVPDVHHDADRSGRVVSIGVTVCSYVLAERVPSVRAAHRHLLPSPPRHHLLAGYDALGTVTGDELDSPTRTRARRVHHDTPPAGPTGVGVVIRAKFRVGAHEFLVGFTDREHGNMSPGSERDRRLLFARRQALTDRPWVWTQLQHSAGVYVLDKDRPPSPEVGADAIVTYRADVCLAVHVADCLGIVLFTDNGNYSVVHAGWRGLRDGVIEAAIEALRAGTDAGVSAVLSPCISASEYEFTSDDRKALVDRYGEIVLGTTRGGTPALDIRAGAREALYRGGVLLAGDWDLCTAANPAAFYSHRARKEPGRMAMFVVKNPDEDDSEGIR